MFVLRKVFELLAFQKKNLFKQYYNTLDAEIAVTAVWSDVSHYYMSITGY